MSTKYSIDTKVFKTAAYKRSRFAYSAQCAFEYLTSLLFADAFLAKLLTNIGMSDSLIGIISSFIYFSFLFQLLSIWLIDRMKNVKRTVILFDTFSQLIFVCMYCVPFLDFDKNIKATIAIVAIIAAYFLKYMVSSILFNWANSYVNPSKRGRFSAVKEIISLLCGMIFTLVVGYVVDGFEGAGNIKGGFLAIILILLVLNALNFISLMTIKNKEIEKNETKASLKEVLKNTVGNKNFRNVIILLSMWNIACCFTVSFMGTFKTNDLLLSVGLVQIINAIANGMRMAFSVPLGKYSDKKSYAKGIELAMYIAVGAFAINMCTTANTWWFVIIYTILYNISIAGTNQNKFNITYSYVKSEYIAQAMAIQNCISGVLGFGASIVGSYILGYVQQNNNTVFGIHMYGQQLLSAISLLIVIFAIIYDKAVVEKQEVMVQ